MILRVVELVRNHQQKHIQLALALGIPLPQNSHEVAATERWAPSSVFSQGYKLALIEVIKPSYPFIFGHL